MKENKKRNLGSKRFDQSFKYRVIEDLLCTGDSAIAVGERYGVTSRTIYEWLRTFGIEPPQQLKTIAMKKKEIPSELEQTLTELKRENARLKAALFHAEAEALAHKTLLEEVANRHHIEVKKKTDLQR